MNRAEWLLSFMSLPDLTIEKLHAEAAKFSRQESRHDEPSLFGVTDGKAIGTYLEQKFRRFLQTRYQFAAGNSANGIDFPELLVDLKVTSIRQPQSSCPYRSARQKIYGLGYGLLVFVYDKTDDAKARTAQLKIVHTVFVEAERTADFHTTRGLREILANEGNRDDVMAFLLDRNLPFDDLGVGVETLSKEIMDHPPEQGFLTISNALQWRLQYARVIEKAGQESGVHAVYRWQA